MCLARAISAAAYYSLNGSGDKWKRYKANVRRSLEEASQLHSETMTPVGPCGPKEAEQLMTHPLLIGFHLIVIDAARAYACFKYGTGITPIAVLYSDSHYDPVSSLPGFFFSFLLVRSLPGSCQS